MLSPPGRSGRALSFAAALTAALATAACASRDGNGTGGATGTGGVTGTGGATATGGATGTGGRAPATGGSTSGGRGGAAGAAGRPGTGGAPAATGGAGAGGSASGGRGGGGGGGAGQVGRDAGAPPDAGGDGPAADAGAIPGTNNPVLPGLFADPNIAVFDGVFYIYPTTDGFANWGATSFSVFSSTNLVKWTNRGVVLDVSTGLKWASGHAWAPSVARVGGTYYDYFTADNQIGVATAPSPTGPFKDALGKPLVAAGQYGVTSIDPNVFIDDDGQPYLYFGNGGLRVAKLNPDMTSFAGSPTNITPAGTSGIVVEGSSIFKRKGVYYLQWSEGDTRLATYRVAYGRASSPLGPFTRLAVILEQDPALGVLGPGGSTVLPIPSRDEYYIVYHRFKIPGGDGTHRETCIDRLFFNDDGTIVPVKPTLQGLQAAVAP
jgi:hypothetical protein